MPAEVAAAVTVTLPAEVRASAVMDFAYFSFALFEWPSRGEPLPDWAASLAAREPDMMVALRRYASDVCVGAEFIVLARRSGTMFDRDLGRFLQRLEESAADTSPMPPMPSETPGDLEHIRKRLHLLAHDTEARHEYVQVVRRLGALVAPVWEREGLPRADRLGSEMRTRLGQPWADVRDLLPPLARMELLAPLVEEAIARRELVLVPMGLLDHGASVYALPGVVLAQRGVNTGQRLARRREEAEGIAGNFKMLSDPTRIMILAIVATTACSITDIAGMLGLSQPTVSVHMKALREAGLVEATREGNRSLYRANRETVRRAVGDSLERLLDPTWF